MMSDMWEDHELEQQLYAKLKTPRKFDEIQGIFPETSRTLLQQCLDALEAAGRIMRNKKNYFAQIAHYGYLLGVFHATERGHGFVSILTEPGRAEPGKPQPDDFYIPVDKTGGAWHTDRVLVQPGNNKYVHGHKMASVVRVIERGCTELNGVVRMQGRAYIVQPSSTKYPAIAVHAQDLAGAQEGDLVSIAITSYGNGITLPQGEVIAHFGNSETMDAAIAAILHKNNVFDMFPAAVLDQAENIAPTVPADALAGRLDLRDKLIFTIDGDDAKDFDDAISLESLENGHWLLGVHIADVSHYVTPGSPLDVEAWKRGMSVYYPGHVVPMLPFALSNGICSLNPNVERLTFSALMEIDKDGRRRRTSFARAVICSKARMTYHKVNQILNGDAARCEEYASLVPTLANMNHLAHTLLQRRMERGALEMDIPEVEVVMDEHAQPVDLRYRERGESERLIEEFMLQANEAVAEYMCRRDYPTVYRIHEKPDPDKLRAFAQFARPFGYRIDPGNPSNTTQLQVVLNGAKSDPKQRVLPMLLLRSLARARYADQCVGHYGLQAKFYLHFTSPIRRYPDLVAHRMLQQALTEGTFTPANQTMCQDAAEQSTGREIAADTCERDIDKLYVALYMKQFIGEEFDGEVTGVQPFGIFVSLHNGCEGLVRLELLCDDYYEYDELHMELRGRHNNRCFTIGTPIRVKLMAASELTGLIDFAPVNITPSLPRRAPASDSYLSAGRRGARKTHPARRHTKGKGTFPKHHPK